MVSQVWQTCILGETKFFIKTTRYYGIERFKRPWLTFQPFNDSLGKVFYSGDKWFSGDSFNDDWYKSVVCPTNFWALAEV